jgi:hypothetical protein
MAMHGPVSNKTHVRRYAYFAKAERHRGLWQIVDSRSGKVLSETCESEAKAWRDVSAKLLANGGALIDHAGQAGIATVKDTRRSSQLNARATEGME